MTVTYEQYVAARDALAVLADERAAIVKRVIDPTHGLDPERCLALLREWLSAGHGEQWLRHEAIIQRARQDLGLAMLWEILWRRARGKATWKSIKQVKKEAAVKQQQTAAAPVAAKVVVSANTKTAPPSEKSRPTGAQRPAPAPARSFSPGQAWRP